MFAVLHLLSEADDFGWLFNQIIVQNILTTVDVFQDELRLCLDELDFEVVLCSCLLLLTAYEIAGNSSAILTNW